MRLPAALRVRTGSRGCRARFRAPRQIQFCLLVPQLEEPLGPYWALDPHDGRGGGGVERRPRKCCWPNSKDGLGRGDVTHVLIYSTSSITLLLLLTPGDLLSCFFKSQYCHFIIPGLPLLLIKKKKEEEEAAVSAGQNWLCRPGGTAGLGCCHLKPKTELRWEWALDSALATGHKLTCRTYLEGHRSAWGWPCPGPSSRGVAWSGSRSGKHFRQPPAGTRGSCGTW